MLQVALRSEASWKLRWFKGFMVGSQARSSVCGISMLLAVLRGAPHGRLHSSPAGLIDSQSGHT